MAHEYRLTVRWSDDPGTVDYRSYTRDHVVSAPGKADLEGSADRSFRGSAGRWNPEELLLAALSECHLLSFLHVAAEAGVVVTSYVDEPVGRMTKDDDGGWSFADVTLRPTITATGDAPIDELHHAAHEACFIARSVAFPVVVEAQ